MNRIAKREDIYLYGERVKEGDIILDTPNNKDGSKSLIYYFMRDQWPNLPDDTTFWFDGDKLGFLQKVQFQHTKDSLQWGERVSFRPLSKVRADNFVFQGANEIVIDGGNHYHWTADRYYMTGYSGFHAIQSSPNSHGFLVSVPDGGKITMRDFESQGGFSGIRVQPDRGNVSKLLIEDFYIHDTFKGEGQYIGDTGLPPTPRFENVLIRNGVVARSAAEAIQLQHMAGSNLRNVTMFCCDTNLLDPFANYQSTALQFVAGGGLNVVEGLIVDGYGTGGYMPYGIADYTAQAVNKTILKDSIFYGGRGQASYFNQSMKNGTEWLLDNVLWGGFKSTTTRPLFSGMALDKITLNVAHDGSKLPITDKTYPGVIQQRPIEAPKYVNSGFHERDVFLWAPTKWKQGWIAIDGGKFYKCLNDHDSTQTPSNNPNFVQLYWDQVGVRSDRGGHSQYSTVPPDDLRCTNYEWGVQIPLKEKIVEEYYLGGKRVTITDCNTKYILQ